MVIQHGQALGSCVGVLAWGRTAWEGTDQARVQQAAWGHADERDWVYKRLSRGGSMVVATESSKRWQLIRNAEQQHTAARVSQGKMSEHAEKVLGARRGGGYGTEKALSWGAPVSVPERLGQRLGFQAGHAWNQLRGKQGSLGPWQASRSRMAWPWAAHGPGPATLAWRKAWAALLHMGHAGLRPRRGRAQARRRAAPGAPESRSPGAAQPAASGHARPTGRWRRCCRCRCWCPAAPPPGQQSRR